MTRPSQSGVGKHLPYGWMLAVHRDMYCDVWDWAGTIRQKELNLGIAWPNIGMALSELVEQIGAWTPSDSLLLEQAVQIHHKAVHIHPFENGNGRWARFIANVWLRRHVKPGIEWPEEQFSLSNEGVRAEYIEAIKLADDYNFGPLTDLHARYWPG